MSTASESPQPLPVPITAVDEKDLITNVPESSHLLEDLKKAGAEINGTSTTIESSEIAIILHVPADPVLETLNNVSEVHAAKEGESFLVPPPIAKLEKEETAREQDNSMIASMAEKEITVDQTQEMLKKQEEEEEIRNREIITTEEVKENVEKEEGPNIPEGFNTIQTKTEEFIPKVGEETQKEEALSQGTEIIVKKETLYEEREQKVEELSFPEEDDPDETKADEPVVEEKTLTEVTASSSQSIEVSSHASIAVQEEENSKLVTDKGIVTESQKEAGDQTELVDRSLELEESLDDQRDVLTTTENSSLVKEEISTATEEQKEETVEDKEVEERKKKDISATEEPKGSSSLDDDPKVQTLDESSRNVETTDSSEIAKIKELSVEGKEEDDAADDDRISENADAKDEVIPPLSSDEKAEGEKVRAADDSHLTHAETKFNEELSALDHPTNLGESSELVDDDVESNAGKESEKPVDQEITIPPETSTERNVMDLEHKESSDKLETNEIVSFNLEREHNEEPSKPELEELTKDTDDVLIQQGHEGPDRNDNHEEQTTQEESYETGLREASAENVVTETETSSTIPTEEVVHKHIIHEESSSTEIVPSAIAAETIQNSEEVKEDNIMERSEEVQTCVPTEADTAESTSEPEVTEMPEKDQTRELFVHSNTSKEDIDNVEAVNPVLEEKRGANEDDILTNETIPEVAVNEKIEIVDSQEESASTDIIALENDTVQKVRDSKPDSFSLENAEIIKDEQVSQSYPEIIKEELEEVTTGSVAVQQSYAKQIIEDKPEEMETKKDLEELINKEQLEELQINKDEPTTHSQETETTKEELREVTPKLAEEPESDATKIVTTERALQSTEPECQDEDIEEETTESSHKQQVEEIITSEPVSGFEEAKTEVIEEVKTDSAEEHQMEAIHIITNDLIPESEEAKIGEIEEVTADEQQSQASQIITDDPEELEIKESEEITTELAEEQQEEVIMENEPIPQSEAAKQKKLEGVTEDSVKEPESEATQTITHDHVAQSEEREIEKEDLVAGVIRPAEQECKNQNIEEETTESSHKQQVEEIITSEPVFGFEEAKTEVIEEVKTDSAEEHHVEAIQIITNDLIPESEEAKIGEIEEAPAEEQQSLASQIITDERSIQPEELKDSEEITTELAEEQQEKVIMENEPTPQSKAVKQEKLEEVTEDSVKEPESEATQAITHDQVAQSEEREIEKEDLVAGVIRPAEKAILENELISQAEEAKKELQELTANPEEEPQSEAAAGEAQKEKLEEVTTKSAKESQSEATHTMDCEQVAQSEELDTKKENPEEGKIETAEQEVAESAKEIESELAKEQQVKAIQIVRNDQIPESEEAKKEELEELTAEPAEEQQSQASQIITRDQFIQPEEPEIKIDPEETTKKLAQEQKEEVIIENELTPPSEAAKKEELEEVTAESAKESKSESTQAVTHKQVAQSEEWEIKEKDLVERAIRLAEEEQVEAIRENELISQADEVKKDELQEVTATPEEEPQSEATAGEAKIEKLQEVTTEQAKEPQSGATHAMDCGQVAQSEELDRRKKNLEEGTIEPVEEVAAVSPRETESEASQPVFHEQVPQFGQLETKKEDTKKGTIEPAEEVAAVSARETESEATQAVVHEQVPQSGQLETKKEDIEEGTIKPTEEVAAVSARETESEVSQAAVPQSGQLETKKKDIEEGTIEPAEEVAAESARETETEASQDVIHGQVPQSGQLETKKEDIEEGTIEPAEEVAAGSARETESEASQPVIHEQVPQSGRLETKKEDVEEGTIEPAEEVAAESARETETEVSQDVIHEQVPQSEQLKKKKEGIEQGTIEPAEEVAVESARETESEASQPVIHEQVPQSEQLETKKEDIEEGTIKPAEEVAAVSARETESEVSQAAVPQSGQLETKKEDIEEGTIEPAEEVAVESARETESEVTQDVIHGQVPQLEQLKKKKEDIENGTIEPAEEVAAESTRDTESEASQPVIHEQVPQSGQLETNKEDIEEGTIEPAEEVAVVSARETESGVSQATVHEQVPQSWQLETKKEDIEEGTIEPAEEVAADSARETESEATQVVVHEQVPQSGQLETKKEDIEEGTIETAEEVAAVSARETKSEASQAVVPQSGQLETKKEDIEEGTIEPAEEVAAELARETETEASQDVIHEQVPQSVQLKKKKESIEEGTIEPAEEVAAESARETESEASQPIIHEQVLQSGQLETKKEDIEEGTIEPAEEVAAVSARETKSGVSQVVIHEQVPQSGQLETKKEDIEEGTIEPAEDVAAESARETETEASPTIAHEQVAQSGQLETKKDDIEKETIKPSEEQQLQEIIQNELISQSEEAKDELQSEAIPTISHERVAQSEDTERNKVNLEEGTVETVVEDRQKTTQVIENEPTPSEEIKKEELQEVATKLVEERDLEEVPIITCEQVSQSEEPENEHLGEARTESAKEQQVEAIQIIKSESTDQSEETKNEIDGIRTETEGQQPLEAVQMIHEQVAQSEVPQTKKGEVEEVTTDSAEEQKAEEIHMIKDETIAQLEEDEREEHEEVPTQSVDELQAEAVQVTSCEQAVQSEQQNTEYLEAKEHDEVATELAEGHQSEAIQIVKEQVGQSDELETEIKGAETVTTESADEPKYEETLSIKNDQAPQSVEPQSKIEDLAAMTTEFPEEQLLGTLQINKNEEATRVEEPTAKTENLVELPTLSMENEQFEAREITEKKISVEEVRNTLFKEAVQPEERANELQQTDDIKPNDFPQKQDANQQTEGAEKVDATESLKEEIEQTEGAGKVDATESQKEEIEQTEGAEKVDATESLKEEIVQIDNETSKYPILHDDKIVPKVQNSEPILSEAEKGQAENVEILSEQQREAPLPQATEAEPEKKEDEEKPEDISVVICDGLEEGPEVETIQQVDNLPKETATELATSEPRQSQEISKVKGAQSNSLGVSQGEALLELELQTEITSCMLSEQPPQNVIEAERNLNYLKEVDHQLEKAEKARETALEAYEQVAQPEVEKENPEEVITKSIQEPTEGNQITNNEAMEEILQEKEMVSHSRQGSPEEANTHVIQPSEERVIIKKEEVQANLEEKVSVATLEEKEPERFGEVVGREILKEEVMQEENDGDVPIKEVEVSEETSKEILELAKVNDEKEAAELKNDEEVSDLQEASSFSENPQANLNNETGEEKSRHVDILKSDEPEEMKLKTAEEPIMESNENESKDSESEAHESSLPIETESAHSSSLDVCQDEEILDSKDDDNSPSEQLAGEVTETKIGEDILEVQSREEIPETADSEEKKEKNPEAVITESVQEEQIESFSQTAQNSIEEHEIEKEVITEPQEVILPEQITKELHEEETKEEETDSATKIEEELSTAGTSRDISELIKVENTSDELQSPAEKDVEEDLKKTEEEFKTVGSSADSGKQEVQPSDSLAPVAKEDKEILPEEAVSEKALKDEVTDRDMDFKDVKVAHVREELELKVSNDSAEEKAAVSEEESSELLQEEINGSSVANLVVSEELDKQTVKVSLKNEMSSGNDTESISVTAEDKEKLSQEVETKKEFQVEELNAIVPPPQEKDSAKTEQKGEEDETEVSTITKPLSEEDLLKTDSSKAVDATSEKAETPSSGQPGIEMSVQVEEEREVETTQVVVGAIPDEKNEEPLTILSSKEELTEAYSSKETIEMTKKGTVLFEDTQKEVPEKEQPKELDIQNFHESQVESDDMVETAADSLLPKQATQELEGLEEVDGRKMLEKEIRQEESATTELLAVNADNESSKEVREIEPISVEALKPIEFNSKRETSKLEDYEDLSDKQEVSTLSEEPKSQPDEVAEEKLEGPIKKAEDVQKKIETHGLESNTQDNISASAVKIANAGGQSVVEGRSTPTSLDDSQDEEILYEGNNSVTSELATAVIETEITKDSVEDTTLQSGFAEKTEGITPQIKIHEEVSQLDSAEIKKDDIEEVTTKSVEGEKIEAIPVMKNDSNSKEEIVEKEEVTDPHQVSPHEETPKEVKEIDELKAEQTVMQFQEEAGKTGTRDYVEEEITLKERALEEQLEADAEDKKTYVFIDDERQDINEEEPKLNLENKDSLPKLEAEVQLHEFTLGTKDERETFITSDEVNPQTELGIETTKLTAEEENASSKAGDGNIDNGISKAADEEKQPPAEVVGHPEKHSDHEKEASAPLKREGEEFGIKFGIDEKGQEACIKEPGNAVVDERCPEEMPEKSSQYIEPKPEFDFEEMGTKISKTDTDRNNTHETQLNKAEEKGEVLAAERAWKLEETPDAASLENPKDAPAKSVQESTAKGAQKAENFSDKDHTHCEETSQKDLEHEREENKREDSGSDGPVLVEASKDMEANRGSPHKKHHNILSGVGSKVKHSISKVKKAITGKSTSHPKSESAK